MEKLIRKKILYVGFVNSESINCDIKDKVKGLNFLLFGFKNSYFCGRNMIQYLDMKSINEIKSLNDQVICLNDQVICLNDQVIYLNNQIKSLNNKFEARFNSLEKRFNSFETKLDHLFGRIGKNEMKKGVPNYLGKKRRRNRRKTKKRNKNYPKTEIGGYGKKK